MSKRSGQEQGGIKKRARERKMGEKERKKEAETLLSLT